MMISESPNGAMKAYKVNADYEAVLFGKKDSLPVINQALEFLVLFLSPRPLLSNKKYSSEYLKHVEAFTERYPEIKSEGEFENWWGELKNIPLEQKLNSKAMSTELNLRMGWEKDLHFLERAEDLDVLNPDIKYLGKNPHGMSGQNFLFVSKQEPPQSYPMVAEPLLNRIFDFSHYIFPNGTRISYQNIVDKKYQYKGTVFRDYTNPSVQNLLFYSDISQDKWNRFNQALDEIVKSYAAPALSSGFSVDSFIHQIENDLHIRYLSEVNYRRTMGEVAFELSLKFGGLRKWSMFLLTRKSKLPFKELKEKLLPITWEEDTSRGVILLSPEDVRFEMFFLSALNEEEGLLLLEELQILLPDSQFPVGI